MISVRNGPRPVSQSHAYRAPKEDCSGWALGPFSTRCCSNRMTPAGESFACHRGGVQEGCESNEKRRDEKEEPADEESGFQRVKDRSEHPNGVSGDGAMSLSLAPTKRSARGSREAPSEMGRPRMHRFAVFGCERQNTRAQSMTQIRRLRHPKPGARI